MLPKGASVANPSQSSQVVYGVYDTSTLVFVLNSAGHKSVMNLSEVEPVSAETMGHQAAPLQRREASLHRQASYLEQNLSSQEV